MTCVNNFKTQCLICEIDWFVYINMTICDIKDVDQYKMSFNVLHNCAIFILVLNYFC